LPVVPENGLSVTQCVLVELADREILEDVRGLDVFRNGKYG